MVRGLTGMSRLGGITVLSQSISMRRPGLRLLATSLTGVVALLVGLVGAAPAAQADGTYCGYPVLGAIEAKYRAMAPNPNRAWESKLGCPQSGEKRTPDGRGRFTTFAGGTIYWTSATGAHAVWGEIGKKWGQLGWERGALGYPKADEFTNPDGVGKRQEYEGGTLYWNPDAGAFAVWGRIGELWGQFGYERGSFGYPTSDEFSISGGGKTQAYQNATLAWYPGTGDENKPGCTSECVVYRASCSGPWAEEVEVFRNLTNGRQSVSIRPTAAAYTDAQDDEPRFWNEIWSCVPYPKGLSDDQGESLYKQMACHDRFADVTGHGGDTWDLEAWRSNQPWSYVTNPIYLPFHECNWD